MRIKSQMDGVYYERWETPVTDSMSLWLLGVLQNHNRIYFFLSRDQESDIHVMSMLTALPYRSMEEAHAYFCIGKYFKTEVPVENSKDYKRQKCNTWKIWGTSFIKELDEGHVLSDYAQVKDENIFEYLLKTSHEWIEFVSEPPTWELYKNTTFKELLIQFSQNLSKESDEE